jgi:aerobic-type carbon monoxide dehydrogenase small subunit (CoxS/CutS family)
MKREFKINVNGQDRLVTTDEQRTLLEVLREELGLCGTKLGCGEGECGACTVLVNGRAVRSCITAVGEISGAKVQTIEGLASGNTLHPVQQAFIDKQAMQCGFCVPGQIMSAVALLAEKAHPSREEIIASMSENICRCCNYPSILAAVEQAAQRS